MARIVCVQGCGQLGAVAARLKLVWLDGLRRGLRQAGHAALTDEDLTEADLNCVSFVDLLCGKTAERRPAHPVRQAHAYLSNGRLREKARLHVANHIAADTQIIVAHSLGSVAAYEAMFTTPDHGVRFFLTLGSPLGLPRLVFHQLQPASSAGRRAWPPGLARWINIADPRDVVAFVRALRPLFGDGGQIEDHTTWNGHPAHSLRSYLAAEETGRAVADGLSASWRS